LKYLVGSVLNPQNVKLLNPSAVLNGLSWPGQEPFGRPSHPNLLEITLKLVMEGDTIQHPHIGVLDYFLLLLF